MEKKSAAPKRLFPLGQVVATPGALDALAEAETTPLALLARHVRGDWGDLTSDDKEENDAALRDGGRIFSAYLLPTQVKLWVITESDRSATTLLLPSEY